MPILNRMGPTAREVVTMISYLMGVGLFIAIIVSSWPETMQSWDMLEYEGEGALRVPVYPIRSFIILGAATTALHLIIKIVQILITLCTPIVQEGRHDS